MSLAPQRSSERCFFIGDTARLPGGTSLDIGRSALWYPWGMCTSTGGFPAVESPKIFPMYTCPHGYFHGARGIILSGRLSSFLSH